MVGDSSKLMSMKYENVFYARFLSSTTLRIVFLAMGVGISIVACTHQSVKDRNPASRSLELDPIVRVNQLKAMKTFQEHYADSLAYFEQRFGVSAESFSQFQAAMQGRGPGAGFDLMACFEEFDHTFERRSQFLDCLGQGTPARFDEEFYQRIFFFKLAQIRNHWGNAASIHQSVAVLSIIEDMTRENIKKKLGRSAQWFQVEEDSVLGRGRFLTQQDFYDYPFQDGDILLSMGTSSISASIPMVTEPQRRYSHSFLIGLDAKGRPETYEAIIERGVIKDDYKAFQDHKYRQLTVLRLKDEVPGVYTREQRRQIIAHAMDFVKDKVRRKVNYNFTFTIGSNDTFFCSNLVVESFRYGIQKVLYEGKPLPSAETHYRALLGSFAEIPNPNHRKFLGAFGMTAEKIPAPGDILASGFLEVVADYRKVDELLEMWQALTAVNVMLERIGYGARVDMDTVKGNVGAVLLDVAKLKPIRWMIERRWGYKIKPISDDALRFMIAWEQNVFSPVDDSVTDQLKKLKVDSLYEVSPWTIRAYAGLAASTNEKVLGQVKYPKK